MPVSTKSIATRDTNDTSRSYARSGLHSSFMYYNNMSWSMWVSHAPGTNKDIWSMWESSTSALRSWLFSTQADGTLRTIFSWDGTSFSLHKTNNAIFDYSWKHVVITFNNGGFACYVDTVQQTLNQTIGWGGGSSALKAANVALMIGNIDPNSPPADHAPGGCFYNFSLWNKVLNAAEILELYNNGVPGYIPAHSSSVNATNWYRMDQTDTLPTLADSLSGSNSSNMTVTKSGATQFFNQTNQVANFSSDPGAANVVVGHGYVINGSAAVGSYQALTVPKFLGLK